MTDAQRRTAVLSLLRKQTAANTKSKAKARSVLIAEGIYTEDGVLREEFGGPEKANQPA